MPESAPAVLDPDIAASPATVTVTAPPVPEPVVLAVICEPPVIESEPHWTVRAPAAGPLVATVAAFVIVTAPAGAATGSNERVVGSKLIWLPAPTVAIPIGPPGADS